MLSKWESPESFVNNHGNPGSQLPKPDPILMTLREVAELLRVSPLTLKRWDKNGKLKAIHINSRGDRRYLRVEIDKLLKGGV